MRLPSLTARVPPPAPYTTSRSCPLKATNKQIAFVLKLAKGNRMELSDLNRIAAEQFGAESLYQLTKRDASRLVDQLKTAA